MIPHTQKPGSRHQNQVSSYLQTKVMDILLREVVHDLLSMVDPGFGLQGDVGLLKIHQNIFQNDISHQKPWDTKKNPLAFSKVSYILHFTVLSLQTIIYPNFDLQNEDEGIEVHTNGLKIRIPH